MEFLQNDIVGSDRGGVNGIRVAPENIVKFEPSQSSTEIAKAAVEVGDAIVDSVKDVVNDAKDVKVANDASADTKISSFTSIADWAREHMVLSLIITLFLVILIVSLIYYVRAPNNNSSTDKPKAAAPLVFTNQYNTHDSMMRTLRPEF